jgi:hypothetical protein
MRVGLWITVVYAAAVIISRYIVGHEFQFNNIGIGSDYIVLIADAFAELAAYIGVIALSINVALPSIQKANARKALENDDVFPTPSYPTPTDTGSLPGQVADVINPLPPRPSVGHRQH